MKRRRFIRTAGAAALGGMLLPEGLLNASEAAVGRLTVLEGGRGGRGQGERPWDSGNGTRIVILHTNDTHSRMDPFPMDGGEFQGLGGVARRAGLIQRIRDENEHVLLLDSGDIFQGTPYFNFFRGEIEFRAMSRMRYDVATIGNHDFDNGVEGLVEMLPHADFQFVSANYDVSASPLAPHVRPWTVREVGGIRVGIFGLGIAFAGLVLSQLHEGVRYTDPYQAARRAVAELREQGCGLVICLSHLGYRYRGSSPSDTLLAQEVEGIDLILGGHTHTFMDEPDLHTHPQGRDTLVHQVGWAGMRLGRVDVAVGVNGSRSWGWAQYPVDPTLD